MAKMKIILLFYIALGISSIAQSEMHRAYEPEFYDNITKQHEQKKVPPEQYRFIDATGNGYFYSQPENWKDNSFFNGWGFYEALEADVIMFELTNKTKYFERASKTIDNIFKNRDDSRGVLNYKGVSPPTWSCGSRYHFSKYLVRNNENTNVLEIKVYGIWAQGKNTGKRVRNEDIKISFSEGSKPNTFNIEFEDPTNLFYNKSHILALRNISVFKGKVLNEELKEFLNESIQIKILKPKMHISAKTITGFNPPSIMETIRADYLVGVGILTRPITKFIKILQTHPAVQDIDKANKYIKYLEETFAYHEKAWVSNGKNQGYYRISPNSPQTPNGVILPWNQQFTYLSAILGLYDVTGKNVYKDKVVKVLNYFKESALSYKIEGNYYKWTYWLWPGHNAIESTHYASIDTIFFYDAYNKGLLDDVFMERITNTWVNIIKPNHLSDRIDGRIKPHKRRSDLGKVSFLAKWNNIILEKSIEWLEADNLVSNKNTHTMRSTAEVIKAYRIKNR